MQTGQRRAFEEVQRINGHLGRLAHSKEPGEREMIPAVRDELDRARVILAFERGMAQLAAKGGSYTLSGDQLEALIDYLNHREGHILQ